MSADNSNLTTMNTVVPTLIYILPEVDIYDYSGETFRERNRMRVSCTECGMTMASWYLKQHMASLHGIYVPHTGGAIIWYPSPVYFSC